MMCQLRRGDVLVFRADLVHAGSPYAVENWRLHCDVMAKKREGDGEDLYGLRIETHEPPADFLRALQLHREFTRSTCYHKST